MDANTFKLNSPEMTKIMRDIYLPAFQVETWTNSGALSEAFGLMKIGQKVNAPTGKLDVYFKKGKSASVGAFGDDYTFDSAVLKPTGDEAVIRTRGFQANARIDVVPNMRLSSAAAIENIFDNQFEDLTASLQKNFGRMLYGDGQGVITTVSVAYTTKSGDKEAELSVADIRPFEIGDIISIGGTAPTGKQAAGVKRANEAPIGTADSKAGIVETSANRGATFGTGNASGFVQTLQIVDIDDIAGTIIVASIDDADVKDIAKDANIYNRHSVNQDIHGLEYIVGDKGMYGLGETEYGKADGSRPKYLKSYEGTADSFLTEAKFMEAIELQDRRGANMDMNMIVTSRGTRMSIASSNQGATTGIVRLMRDAGATAANDERSLGYQGVDLKGQSVEVDRFAKKGDVWFLDLSNFEFAVESDMQYDDFNGVIWKQVITSGTAGAKVSRQLSYEANMFAYKELFNKNPRTLGRIKIATPKLNTVLDTNLTPSQVEVKIA